MKPENYLFCELCHAQKAVQVDEPEYYTYRSKTKLLWFRHLFCYNCKADYASHKEMKYNHTLIVDFKQEVDAQANQANQVNRT